MGAFKLGKMTFGSLFKKPETVLYPFETKPQPAGLKGHIAIDVDTCILCGMCDKSCATDCITVDKNARTWSIDRLQCVQCGYCITVCPKDSLSMDPNYAPATTIHEADTFAVPEQAGKSAKPAAKATKDAKPAPKPDVGKAADKPAPSVSANEPSDPQVEALIDLMDEAAAEKVRAALG